MITKVRGPIDKAIDKVIDKGAKVANKVGDNFNNSKAGKKLLSVKQSAQDKKAAAKKWIDDKKTAAEAKIEKQKSKVANSKLGKKITAGKGRANKKLEALDKKKEALNGKMEKLKNLAGEKLEKLGEKIKGKFKQSKVGQKLSEKKEKAKAKYEKVKGKVKEKVASVVEWWKARKQFKAEDGKTHTLFFKGADKNSTLMVASNPKPYTQFLEWVEGNETEELKKEEKRIALVEAKKIAIQIEEEKGRNRTDQSVSQKDFDQEKAQNIETLLENLRKFTAKLFGADVPVWQPPNLTGKNTAGFGISMEAECLTRNKINKGSEPTTAQHETYDILNQRRGEGGASYYIRGHLLNEKLGGKGVWENMTPLSRPGNSEHEARLESLVKAAVDSGAIIQYYVKPVYGSRSDKDSLKAEIEKDTSKNDVDKTKIKEIVEAEDWVPKALDCHIQRKEKDGSSGFKTIGSPLPWMVLNNVARQAKDYFLKDGASTKNEPININSRDVDKLKKIPGITANEANNIVNILRKRKNNFGQCKTLASEAGLEENKVNTWYKNGDIKFR
jgi:hypothetical protein